MFLIYMITCFHPSYGSHVMPYVGWTSRTIQQRFREHLSCHSSGASELCRAIKAHGKEWFVVEQIDACSTRAQAKECERFWIARLKTQTPFGYNIDAGGSGRSGFKHSAETRKKMSLAGKGRSKSPEHRKRIGEAHARLRSSGWKRVVTDETRQKMSEVHKGKPVHSEEYKKALSNRMAGNTLGLRHSHTDESRQKMSDFKKLWWAQRRENNDASL